MTQRRRRNPGPQALAKLWAQINSSRGGNDVSLNDLKRELRRREASVKNRP